MNLPSDVPVPSNWHQLIEDWPRSIRKLELSFDGLFLAFEHLKLSTYFPVLQELSLDSSNSFSLHFLEHLPHSVTSLSVETACSFDAADLAERPPRQLLHFKSGSISTDVAAMAKALPSTLTSLNLYNAPFDKKTIKLLPHMLRELWISVVPKKTDLKMLSKLPQSLRILKLFGGPESATPLKCSDLPPQLEVLDLQFNVKKVEMSTLPRTITDLGFQEVSFPATSNLAQLPPKLKKLSISHAIPGQVTQGAASFKLSLLPKSLTYLHIGLIDNASSMLNDDTVRELPPNLTTLFYDCDVDLSGKCFANLPRSLRSLRLGLYGPIKDSDVSNLPPHLKMLDLVGCTTLGDTCVPLLPRGLRSLNLGFPGTRFTATCILNLPPYFINNMNDYNLANADVAMAHRKYLADMAAEFKSY